MTRIFHLDRTALITGAGSGIGRALAIEASRRCIKLALVGRHRDTLVATQCEIDRPEDCLVIVADVATPAGRESIRALLASAWGRLDVLVNNAGVVPAGPLSGLRDPDLDRLIATNLTGPIALTRELLPLLQVATAGRLVNIGSLAGDIALPLFSAYSATKFGLRGLSNALRLELGGFGVGVTYAAPSGVRTAAAEAVAPFTKCLGMRADGDPAAIAIRIWDAVERGADSVYPGAEKWLVAIERLIPVLIRRALARRLAHAGGRCTMTGGDLAKADPRPRASAAMSEGGAHAVEG